MRRPLAAALALVWLAAAPARAQVEEHVSVAPSVSVAPAAPAALSPTALAPLAVPLAPALSAPASFAGAPGAVAAAPAAVAPRAAAAVLAAPAAAAVALAPAAAAPATAPSVSPQAAARDAGTSPAHAGAPAAHSALDELGGADSSLDRVFDGKAGGEDALTRRSFPATPQDFPGGSGALTVTGRSMRALLTKGLAPQDLPYSTTLRAPVPVSLPISLERAPRAAVNRATDVAFASVEHSGSAGLVRLGYLDDGRPVALKAYHLRNNQQELERYMLEEARSAKLLSDLGIGPRFHGVWRDADGSWNVVFDIARGDFNGTPVTMATFRDLETIFARLQGASVNSFPDLQMFRDGEGRLSVIDPAGAANDADYFSSPDETGGYATQARMEQLHSAPSDVGRRYLTWLRAHKPAAYRSLHALVMRRNDPYVAPIKARLPDFFSAAPGRNAL